MFEISLLGKKDSSIELMKTSLLENAENAGFKLKINQNIANEDLLNQGLTVSINGTIKAQGTSELIDFFREVNSIMLKEHSYGTMKKIIVPIDFSDCSYHALNYAFQVAKDYHAVLKLIFVYPTQISSGDEKIILNYEMVTNLEKQLAELQKELNNRFKADDWHSPMVEAEFRMGQVADQIVDFADENENSFVVMGSIGGSDVWDKLFGTISASVVQNCKSPVLVIPPNTIYKKLNHVAYCSNDIELDKAEIFQLLSLIKPIKPYLHLLHIENDYRAYDATELVELAQDNYYKDRVIFDLIGGGDKTLLLDDYCTQKDIDLLVLSKKDEGFMDRLFHKSFAKEIRQYIKLPLLIVHDRSE